MKDKWVELANILNSVYQAYDIYNFATKYL